MLFRSVLEAMEAARFQPPSPEELAAAVSAQVEGVAGVLTLLEDEGEVHRIEGDLFLSAKAMAEAEAAVVSNCEANGGLEIPELRDALGTTRKFLIPILEHFDAMGVTMRQAGRRVLKRH